jgi:hypothetical protein
VQRVAEVVERDGFGVVVADVAEQLDGLAVGVDGLLILGEVVVGVAEAVERVRLAISAADGRPAGPPASVTKQTGF